MNRRTFLQTGLATLGLQRLRANEGLRPPVDFRYAPLLRQAPYCFPDDPQKSLVGERGDLRYGFDRRRKVFHFTHTVQFGLAGMDREPRIRQWLEAPELPVIHTRLEYTEAFVELITFATARQGEGRH